MRRRCLALPPEGRADLAGMLLQSLEPEKAPDKEKTLATLRDTIREAYGVDIREAKTRQQPVPDCKVIFAYLALQVLPITHTELGQWMGADHSTIHYYRERMRAALATPASDPRLVAEYKTIIEQYGKNNS